MKITNANHLITALGEETFLDELGFTERLLRHVKRTKKIASQRYVVIKDVCDDRGIPCPLSAFSFTPSDKLIGNGKVDLQGAGKENPTSGDAV